MRRRSLVALVSASVLLVLGVLAIGVGVILTRTDFGRERIRRIVAGQVSGNLREGGSVHIGRVTGGLIGGLAVDTVAVRSADGQLVFSAGFTRLAYDIRDILDRRLLISYLEVTNPYVHLVQYEDGSWNYKQVFREAKQQVERRVGRRFGDFVVIDSARVRNGTFILTMPWHPADTLRGAKRDSSIREHLGRPGGAFHRTREGHFAHTYRWTDLNAWLSHARIADPDSAGRQFEVARLDVKESEPPFTFHHAQLSVRHLGDSIWLESPRFHTTASHGRARGKVVWGSGLPIRYDVRVWGDSVALDDVAWVYPTLPRQGGGRMVLDIRNDPRNLRIIDYRLSDMDVRSTGSRLRGAMTFAVGGPVLAVKDVALRAEPVDFDLLRTLAGEPFPVDWQGTLTGDVTARGGPLTRFVVDRANITFRDEHVPGATSAFTARGGLNILQPAFTDFLGLRVDVERLDLRTVQHLYPEFPPLGGIVSGVATLDSSWLDVRFRDADIAHRNGPETPSRVTGRGRVTYGDVFLVYDLDLVAQPLSLPHIARAWPDIPVTGLVSGPIRARGTTDSLELSAVLAGDAGTVRFDGVVDIYEPEWRARGAGTVAALDAPKVFTVDGVPATELTGSYDVDLSFLWGGPAMDSLVAIGGRAAIDLDRSVVDGVRLQPSLARLRFAEGRVLVDTLRVATTGAVASAAGGLGLAGGPSDSLDFSVAIDSLGALRRYLAASASEGIDSLAGRVVVTGAARGRLDSLVVAGRAQGSGLLVGSSGADSVVATFDVADLTGSPSGAVQLRLRETLLAGMRSDSARAELALDGARGGAITAQLFGGRGPGARLHAAFRALDSLTRIDVDTLTFHAGDHSVALVTPATITLDTAGGIFLDSLLMRDPHHGTLRLSGRLPAAGPVVADLVADSIEVADLASILHRQNDVTGTLRMRATLRGTREAPVLAADLDVANPGWGDLQLDRISARAAYDTGLVTANLDVRRNRETAVGGALVLPMQVTIGDVRTVDTDSIRGWLAAERSDLSLVSAVTPKIADAQGHLSTRLDLAGTWERPLLGGYLNVDGGAATIRPLGIRVTNVATRVQLVPGADSLHIDRITANSGGLAALRGWVTMPQLDPNHARFDLQVHAREFRAIDDRAVAQLVVSTGGEGLRLAGDMSGATLDGTLSVDRGSIFIPDVRDKAIVQLTDEDFRLLDDTVGLRVAPPAFAASPIVENLTIEGVSVILGDDVWLRSREANVKLAGALNVTRAVDVIAGASGGGRRTRGDTVVYRPSLAGTLVAERGTYTLDLGLVRRVFDVETGTITFVGTPDLNPDLNISAVHTVRQRDQEDVRIRARLSGQLYPQPTLQLESASSFALSPSDLISYLVTGRPSIGITSLGQQDVATSVLLPTAGVILGETLREQLGGWLDQIRFETGTSTVEGSQQFLAGVQQGIEDLIYRSRLGGEKQIGENVFLSLSSGLCQLDPNRQGGEEAALEGFVNQLAWRFEYRWPELTLQAGREPSSTSLACGGRGAVRGVVNTPAQWAISLKRTWRF